MSLYAASADKSAGDQAVYAYPISAAWNEKTITSMPAYGGALTNIQFSTLNSGQWATFSLPTNTVQGWLSGAAANHGVLIRTATDDPAKGSAPGVYPYRDKAVFSSKEDPNLALRPKLTIAYTPPAAPNVRPLAGIVSPADNAVFAPGQAVPITVNSSDPDGTITNVRVYAGATLLGEYTHALCTNVWNSWTTGSATLTAVAYDNKGACSTSAPVVVRRRFTIYLADMNANPGWTLEGSRWAYGRPTGAGPSSYGGGYPDPAAGFTGTNVIGYYLGGCFSTNATTVYATTPAIDCRSYTNVNLEFYGWLGVFNGGSALVQISNDGAVWTTIWSNGSGYSGAGWWYANLNISSYASRQSAVYVRWAQSAISSSYYGYNFCGWNVDDVRITGDAGLVTDAMSLSVTEGSNATFSVKLPQQPAGATTVSVTRVSGDAGIDVSTGSTLVFGTNGWNTWQPVTVASLPNSATSNTVALIRCGARGYVDQNVIVTSVDMDCSPPARLDAGDGTSKSRVRVTWSGVAKAQWYEVWRNTLNATNTAARIADHAATTNYDDTRVDDGTSYYYWIRSANPASTSAFSVADTGFSWPSYLKWGYKTKIAFGGYNRSEPLTNFPLLVVFNTSLPGFTYGQLASPANGGDLRFTDADETTFLNYEFDSWNPTGGVSSFVWVQVPAVTSNGHIWACWGNPLRKNPLACATNGAVWDETFRGVWHLAETSGAHRSSAPGIPSSEFVQVAAQGTAAGVVGGADTFDGNDDYVDLPDMGTQAQVTVECWANLGATPSGAQLGLVSSDPWSAGVCRFGTGSNLNVAAAISGAGALDSGARSVAAGTWFHAAYTVAGSGTKDFKLYLDGVQRASGAGSSNNDLTDVNIGREFNGRHLNGRVDEVRISTVPRSSSWIWASCMNVAANRSFLSYGPVITNRVTLTVGSAVASAVPPAGSHEYPYGQVVTGLVTSPVLAGRTRYVASQWRLAPCEGAPLSAAGTNVVLAMTNDMTLTWLWDMQHLFTATNAGRGAISGPTWRWCSSGEVVTVTGVASDYCHFVNWSGDVPAAACASNPVSLAILQPCALAANFAETLATNSTPHWWLAQYGWTNNCDWWALQDPDQDSMKNWQEATAGTDPTNFGSKLMIGNAGSGGWISHVLTWPGVSGRLYSIERGTSLQGQDFELCASNLPAVQPVNVYTDNFPVSPVFYRIRVNRAP